MRRSIAVPALAALLLAACSSGPIDRQQAAERDEGYTPIGSNITRREARRTETSTRVGQGQPGAGAAGKTTP